jgi:hypothetical protein
MNTILPIVGIAYVFSAIGCALWAIWRNTDRVLWSLSGIILSIAIVNTYAEEWPMLRGGWYAVPTLIVFFLLPYRSLCLRLIERTGLRNGFVKEQYSFLPLVYVGLGAVAVTAPFFVWNENPAYVVFTFIVFVCALHVPAFAYGNSRVRKFGVSSGIALQKAASDISRDFFKIAIAILGTPLALALVRAVVQDDYRLFGLDAVLTGIIFSLLAISKPDQLKQKVSEQQASSLT